MAHPIETAQVSHVHRDGTPKSFVSAGHMAGETAYRDAVRDLVGTALGGTEGSGIVATVTVVPCAIPGKRRADLSFMPSACGRIARAETALMGLVTEGYAGRADAPAIPTAEHPEVRPVSLAISDDDVRPGPRGAAPAAGGMH